MTVTKTKAEVRLEMEKQLAAFLKRGGSVQVVKTRSSKGARTWMKR